MKIYIFNLSDSRWLLPAIKGATVKDPVLDLGYARQMFLTAELRRPLSITEDDTRLILATEIKENIEIVYTKKYSQFLQTLLPHFVRILSTEEPVFELGDSQKLRLTLLEIINRLPNNEFFHPYYEIILKLTMSLLAKENEENALVCLRIILELHKYYRSNMSAELVLINKFSLQIFSCGVSDGRAKNTSSTKIPKSTHSFKVLTECPMLVVILVQIYKEKISWFISRFVEPCVAGLELVLPKNQSIHSAYNDLIACQIKILSFVAYVIRLNGPLLEPHKEKLPGFIIYLLSSCQGDLTNARKELLMTTRHIIGTDLYTVFVPYIELLLDEELLLGESSLALLRPLAYGMLAELLHHSRNDLTFGVFCKAVSMYSLALHDPQLPIHVQTMACKLILNLTESFYLKLQQGQGQEERMFLLNVFKTISRKFNFLRKVVPYVCEEFGDSSSTLPALSTTMPIPSRLCHTKSYIAVPGEPKTHFALLTAESKDDIAKDLCALVRALVLSLRSITAELSKDAPQGDLTSSSADTLAYHKLLRDSLPCFKVFLLNHNPHGPVTRQSLVNASLPALALYNKEEKDVIDNFCSIFFNLHLHLFNNCFHISMPQLFREITENQTLIVVPQHILTRSGFSSAFTELLLDFLVDQLSLLGAEDSKKSLVILRLFTLIFGAVSLFPEQNEPILQLHLSKIVRNSLNFATQAINPMNYFMLFRSLFRCIGAGKLDLLYREFVPLLPLVLKKLNRFLNGTANVNFFMDLLTILIIPEKHPPCLKEVFVELCLTVPVRLSALLAHLHLLMRPLVFSLQVETGELPSQGLRTLELCVDNLTPEFLDPIMAPVRLELMQALWSDVALQFVTLFKYNWFILRSFALNRIILSYISLGYDHLAMRILGKLGGRSKSALREHQQLAYVHPSSTGTAITP
ncbi:hypothetical protein Zmor_012018 [Zophobas morio]|uniref:Transformation/transcription domain-associated protein n=1 Tax=Zophobas morio TaxID=2755281 RepID=A0AA38LYN0_9CUCU|nr:hypothetical protein Zmor_012018 [Zophobas morio]